MRRWLFMIAVILLASFLTGIYLRSTYTNKDYSDKENLSDHYVWLLTEEDMLIEEPLSEEDYLNIDSYDPYVGEVASETNIEEDYFDDPEKEIIIEVSWFGRWKYELESAECVALGKSTGKMDNLGGALQQEVEILKVYKGELFEKADVVLLVNAETSFAKNDEGREFLGINTNLMEEGKQYLVFFNSTPGKFKHLFYGAALNSRISYFAIEDYDKGYLSTEESLVSYSDLKDVEFFCNDEKIYTQILEVKHDMIKKYVK